IIIILLVVRILLIGLRIAIVAPIMLVGRRVAAASRIPALVVLLRIGMLRVVLWVVMLRIVALRIAMLAGGRIGVAIGMTVGLAIVLRRAIVGARVVASGVGERIALADQARELGERVGRRGGIAAAAATIGVVAIAARIRVIPHPLPSPFTAALAPTKPASV